MKLPSWIHKSAFPIAIGAAGGLLYGALDWYVLDRLAPDAHKFLLLIEELVDLVIPVFLGATLGFSIHLFRRQRQINKLLSLENSQLQQHIWINTLIAQVLHDIRNPLHNLCAVLEDTVEGLNEQAREPIMRNLERLEQTTAQYGRWAATFNELDPRQKTALHQLVEQFVRQKVKPRLEQLHVDFVCQLDKSEAFLHPIFAENILTALFSNALATLEKTNGPRALRMTLRQNPFDSQQVRLLIKNTGLFPAEVLDAQGKQPITDTQGLGIGLLLVNKMIEQIGGSMRLENSDGFAVIELNIPGRVL